MRFTDKEKTALGAWLFAWVMCHLEMQACARIPTLGVKVVDASRWALAAQRHLSRIQLQ